MQTHGGLDAATVIESRDRVLRAEVKIDWNRNGLFTHVLSDVSSYLSEVSTDRSLRGSAPEELMLIEGASAAELSMTIGGDYLGMSLAAVFSPHNTASVLYGDDLIDAELTYRLGVETPIGLIWYQQFVGSVRTVSPDRGSGKVEITALDRVEMLRRPVQFPPYAVNDPYMSVGNVSSQLVNTQWVIDHCLRFCDTSPSPLRHTLRSDRGLADDDVTGTQLWVSGAGSFLPSIGWMDNGNTLNLVNTDTSGVPMYQAIAQAHPNSPEPATKPLGINGVGSGASAIQYWSSNRDQINDVGMQLLGFTLNTTGPNGAYYKTAPTQDVMVVRTGNRCLLRIKIGNSGKVWTERYDEITLTTLTSSQVTIPTTGDHIRIVVMWDAFNPAGAKVNVTAGANSTPGGYETISGPLTWAFRDDDLKGRVTLHHKLALSDIVYTATNFGGLAVGDNFSGIAAKYAAVLDEGRNRLSYMPPRYAEDAWDVIKDAAGAEYGSVFWDEAGIFRFWSLDRILDQQGTISRTLTLDDVGTLNVTRSLDSVRNIWSVEAKKRRSKMDVVYRSSLVDEFYVPGVTTKFFRLWVDDVLSVDPFKLVRFTSAVAHPTIPEWNDFAVTNGYVAQWLIGGVWQEDDTRGGVDVTLYHDNDGYLVVRIWNGWSEPVRLAQNSGEPAMHAYGTRIISAQSSQVTSRKDSASVAKYKPRNMRVSGDWYQETYDNNNMVSDLLARTTRPIPTTDDIEIPGDPRLQLGDVVRILDPDGFGQLFDLQIYGIRRTWSTQGLRDVLTVEMIPVVGYWDDPVYGLWDTTLIWG